MSHHLIDFVLKRDNGSELAVEIHFDYHLPPHFLQWQDKSHGSIQFISIKNKKTSERIIDLTLDEHLQLFSVSPLE